MQKMTNLLRRMFRKKTKRVKEPFTIYDIRSNVNDRVYDLLWSFAMNLSKKYSIKIFYIDTFLYGEGIGIKLGICGHDEYGKIYTKHAVRYPKDFDMFIEKHLGRVMSANGYIDYVECDIEPNISYASYAYIPIDENKSRIDILPISEECGIIATFSFSMSRVMYLKERGITEEEIYDYLKVYIDGWFAYQ